MYIGTVQLSRLRPAADLQHSTQKPPSLKLIKTTTVLARLHIV